MKEICPESLSDWRNWLEKNHLKEERVLFIKYKKHTGKPIIYNIESMKTAICFGWIDTTLKRIDEDKYAITYVRRNKNSKWSINTLAYGKELLEKGLMSEFGIKMYKEGLLKKPHDYNIPKNPDVPKELEEKLNKNKKTKEKFEKLSPSLRKMHLRNIIRAKLPETREKRMNNLIKNLKTNG